jgi:hypothetical protein
MSQWSAPTFLRVVGLGTQSSLGQVLEHMSMRMLFTDETMVAPLAASVHSMMENALVDETTTWHCLEIATGFSHD